VKPRSSPRLSTESLAAGAGNHRTRRFGIALAAVAAYLGLAFALKPDFAARISDTLSNARDSISDRFHKRPDQPVNLNTATAEELQQLPGIGPVIAREIIRFREQSGPIRRPEDLLALPRFTRRSLDRIRPYIVMNVASP
jgi:competence ComEA-like helix-hairpin-helix protein